MPLDNQPNINPEFAACVGIATHMLDMVRDIGILTPDEQAAFDPASVRNLAEQACKEQKDRQSRTPAPPAPLIS